MKPRVLIVGTVPYNQKSTSRAFDSYFHYWEKENLAQVFSNTKTPTKGHCEKLYQITDQRMLKRWFSKTQEVGKRFHYDELPAAWTDDDLEVGSKAASRLYRWGSRKNSVVYLLRGLIWRKRYWCTEDFNKWLDEFRPECVFLSFSDDFFIPKIALYVADRYNIPIVSSIGDDYYFNYKKTLSPLYHLYKLSYRRLIRKILKKGASAIYIGDKIRDKYNGEFGLRGETVYLTSDIKRRDFRPIPITNPIISYFGNIRLGRNDSLCEIGNALGEINPGYVLHVYSNESDPKYYDDLKNNSNIEYHGSIPYSEVQKRIAESDIVVVVEGFKKKDVDITRYSLSTKVADSLASGVAVLAYGSEECGAIEYAKSIGCITACTENSKLRDEIKHLLESTEYQRKCYEGAAKITQKNHTLQNSTRIFEDVVTHAVNGE